MSNELATADGSRNATIVYVLYLVGLITGGVAGLIGVVFAYLSRGEGEEWVRTHYQFQIRTFWMSFGFGIVIAILTMLVVGVIFIPVLLIWFIIRCAKGLKLLSNKQPIADPTSWLFG